MIFLNKASIITIAFASMTNAAPELLKDSPSLKMYRALESEPFLCQEALDCRDCFENGCAWAVGECMDSCDEIADASCFSKEYFPNKSAREVCRTDWNDNKDWQACSIEESCGACISTSLPSGNGNCFWHEETKACKPIFSDAWSTGSSTCIQCDRALDCRDCFENGCAWAEGDCMDSCDLIADASCFSKQYFPNKSSREVCRTDWNDNKDWRACDAVGSCGECTSTLLPSGKGSCFWHEEVKACKPLESDAWSTGEGTCDGVKIDKCSKAGSSCNSCLNSDCVWTGDECFPSCDFNADGDCWSKETFPKMDTNSICRLSKVEDVDQQLCAEQTAFGCSACVGTALFDGVNTCEWYTDSSGKGGWCGVGGCDMNGVCGTKSCDADIDFIVVVVEEGKSVSESTIPKSAGTPAKDVQSTVAASGSNVEPGPSSSNRTSGPDSLANQCAEMSTCLDCLDNVNNCAWIDDSCYESCTDVPDAACYKEDLFPQLEEEQICRLAGDYGTASDSLDGDFIEETLSCWNMTNCRSCLENDNNCAWIMDSCQNSCDDIQDVSCYAEIVFPELEEREICRIAEEDYINAQLCGDSTTCSGCTSTKKLDGSTCSWFTAEYDSSITWCSADEGCDMWGNCGVTACEIPNAGSVRGKGGKPKKSHKNLIDWLSFP